MPVSRTHAPHGTRGWKPGEPQGASWPSLPPRGQPGGDQPSCCQMALCREGPRLGRRRAALCVSPLRVQGLTQRERQPVAGKAWPAHRHLCPPSQATAGFLPLVGFAMTSVPTSVQGPGCNGHSSGCGRLILDSRGAKCSFWSRWTPRSPGQWPFSAPSDVCSQPGPPCV